MCRVPGLDNSKISLIRAWQSNSDGYFAQIATFLDERQPATIHAGEHASDNRGLPWVALFSSWPGLSCPPHPFDGDREPMASPKDCRFTESHEWFSPEGDVVTVGITRYAADELTDITYVEMKPPGTTVDAGESLGEVESVKTTSDVYAAVGGEIVEVNAIGGRRSLAAQPRSVRAGWLVKIRTADHPPLEALMDQPTYDQQSPGRAVAGGHPAGPADSPRILRRSSACARREELCDSARQRIQALRGVDLRDPDAGLLRDHGAVRQRQEHAAASDGRARSTRRGHDRGRRRADRSIWTSRS